MKDDYTLKTSTEMRKELAEKVRKMRLILGLKQSTLSKRSGISLPSLRRFERTGKISLDSLLDIASAMGCLNDFDAIFTPPKLTSINDLEEREQKKLPKRGNL